VKRKWHFLVALTASFAVLISAQSAYSGTTGYDMSRLIDEPHPFAADAAAQVPPKIVTFQPSDASTYTIPGSVTGGVRQGQPYSAGRPSRSASTQSAPQGTGASTIPESLPPQLGFPMVTSIPASKSAAATSIIRAPVKKLPVQVSDSAFYSYGGIAFDWKLGKFVFTPSFAAGAYRDGDGKDLGHVVEFRSAIEIAYEFENRHRLGLIFYHLSNASISDNNPGTEVLSLGYSIPFD
jgi:hypothetical protein